MNTFRKTELPLDCLSGYMIATGRSTETGSCFEHALRKIVCDTVDRLHYTYGYYHRVGIALDLCHMVINGMARDGKSFAWDDLDSDLIRQYANHYATIKDFSD